MRDCRLAISPRVAEGLRELPGFSDEVFDAHFLITPDLPGDEAAAAGPAELVRQSRSWFATIVPAHIDAAAFVALALAYLRRNASLAAAAQCNPQGLLAALAECARLGLVPGDTFHLVPFCDTETGEVVYARIVGDARDGESPDSE